MTAPRTHSLKCVPPFFASVRDGSKPFEVRFNDRDFQVGDLVELKEWTGKPIPQWGYTGEQATRRINYVLKDFPGLERGHVVLGLEGPEKAELDRLRAQLNTPELHDFAAGVAIEGAHQRERWGSDHDAGKTPEDWFWLIGYLAGKALAAAIVGNVAKARHHCISTAAALANWHAALSGENRQMRPGLSAEAVSGIDRP